MWGGGIEGLNSPFPYPLIPFPALYLLAPASLHVSIAKYCAMLRNFSLFLPLPYTLGIPLPAPLLSPPVTSRPLVSHPPPPHNHSRQIMFDYQGLHIIEKPAVSEIRLDGSINQLIIVVQYLRPTIFRLD